MNESHWGAVFCYPEPGKEFFGRLMWGDSLGLRPPQHMLEFVHSFLNMLQGNVCWLMKGGNFILDVLSYEKQKDGYSCGCYFLSALSSFAKSKGRMPDGTYEKYSPEKKQK